MGANGRASLRAVLHGLPRGYSQGRYEGRRYGTTLTVSADGRRSKLFAEELGGRDVVSFNLYRLQNGESLLKPCEMSAAKVLDFVARYVPDAKA